MKNIYLNKILYIIISVSIILIVCSILAFIINFKNNSISHDLEKWGQFADYIGGMLNPLLSAINICIFVILTLTIQNITDKNNQQNIETTRKIALMSMKSEELRHFKESMDSKISAWEDNLMDISKVKNILYTYNVLEYRMIFLFPELRDSYDNKNFRRYIVEALTHFESGKLKEASYIHVPLSNTYGMLISSLSEWTIR